MRVCIDARIPDERSGGVQQVILGLASGLASLSDGDEDYIFITYAGRDDWLRPAIAGRCRIEPVPLAATSPTRLRQKLRRIPILAGLVQKLYRAWRMRPGGIRPAPSSGIFERLGADVVHFPMQAAELVDFPSIYHPHDLQHIHYPEYFTAYERRVRDVQYRAYVRNATTVAVVSDWVKQDLAENLDCPADKICVVPFAPPNTMREYAGTDYGEPLQLPDCFFFYPAQTWPHKNHAVLIEALARLHARGVTRAHLVFTGAENAHRRVLDEQIARLHLGAHVHFLGFVTPARLSQIYSRCVACIIPSLFEAASFPAWEAFFAGAPVAAARITSLPAQIGDAGLLFEPRDSEALSKILQQLAEDDVLRETLIARGHARVRELSWHRTALCFRALYRKIGNRPLSAQDRAFLESDPGI